MGHNMSDAQKSAPQGLQASITAGIGTFATASCMKWLPAEHAQYWVSACTLLSPVVGYFIEKFFWSIDEPEALTRYKARLRRDLKHQKKILEDENVSDAVKADVRAKYEETLIKLSTANQDYSSDGMVLSE